MARSCGPSRQNSTTTVTSPLCQHCHRAWGGGDSIRDAPFTSAELEDLAREGRQIHLGCEPQGRLEGRHASLPLRRPHAVGDMPRQAPRESH
jgi:hypothetical protein